MGNKVGVSHVNRVIIIEYGNYYTIIQAYDFFPSMGQQPLVGQGLLIIEALR
jgi:hypothetical protein